MKGLPDSGEKIRVMIGQMVHLLYSPGEGIPEDLPDGEKILGQNLLGGRGFGDPAKIGKTGGPQLDGASFQRMEGIHEKGIIPAAKGFREI